MQLSKEQLLDAAQAAGYSRGLVDADLMLVAINAYCAQADARPFGWWYSDKTGEHFSKRGPDSYAPGDLSEYEVKVTPLYTHPEASALGLSEAQIDDLAFGYCPSGKIGELREFARAILASAATVAEPSKLAVWYGPMPESNGKTNWTAILHNGDITKGITLDRSEFPDRVRYEADRARFLIGELKEAPCILDYDADKCEAARQQAEPGADERAAQSVNELPRVANSLGGFRGGFIGVHGRAPTEQEIWNGGVRSGLDRAAQSGQRAGVAEDVIEAAAKKLAEDFDYPWEHMPAQGKDDFRAKVRSIAAMLAAAPEEK